MRPPLPPFTSVADAEKKVQMAEDAWNTRDPEKVSLAYTEDRNGPECAGYDDMRFRCTFFAWQTNLFSKLMA